MLTKNSLVSFVPGSPGRPKIPAVPAHPAYCETKTVTKLVLTPIEYICGVTPGGGCIPTKWAYIRTTVTETKCYPASAGSPAVPAVKATKAQWITDRKLGWNAGAYSVTRHPVDAYVSFKVPAASGAIVGFNRVSSGVSFAEIAHGIYFQEAAARVYESGVAKGEVLLFAPTDTFIIERVNSRVSYYRKVEGASPVRMYQSLTLSLGSIIVDASMYSGGDRID